MTTSLYNDIEDFAVYQTVEKGHSPHTLEAYKRDLNDFLLFLGTISIYHWKEVEQEHVIQFLNIKKENEYATASIARALVVIKVFFHFLKREGVITKHSLALLETPKIWQLIPDILSVEEIEILFEQPDTTEIKGARDRAILEVLYATGMRVSELCQLSITDIDDHFLRVRKGKGSKERLIPIGSKAIEAIDHYLSFRHGEEQGAALFIGRGQNAIDRVTVWSLVKKYAKEAGITKTIFPHTFRHSFATHLLDHGADLRIIQEMLGHASIDSTDRYTQVSCVHLQDAFHQCHPRQQFTD